MGNKVVGYCDPSYNCCSNTSVCYNTLIEQMVANTSITYEAWNNTSHPDQVAKYGLTRAPTILLFQEGALRQKVLGKGVEFKLRKIFNSIPWW